MAKEGIVRDNQVQLRRPDGLLIWVRSNARAIRDDKGNVQYWGTIRDITAERTAQAALLEARSHVEFFNDLMTHDITNIHQGILSLLELILRDTTLSTSSAQQARMALGQLDRSTDLIRKVKRFTRLDTPASSLTATDLAMSLQAALEAVRGSFPRKKLRIKTRIRRGRYYPLADEFLHDLLFNLLHNAAKFDRRTEVEVEVVARREGRDLKIQVKDHGPGVPDEDKDRLFTHLEPRERRAGGVRRRGVGLTLVMRIVNRYGGKIWVEDRIPGDPSQGSCFVILLPRGEKPSE